MKETSEPRRRRWPVVTGAVLLLGGAGMLDAAAAANRGPDEPPLVASAAASAPGPGPTAASTTPEPSASSPTASPAAASPSSAAPVDVPAPVSVSIPAIGVDSPLLSLGLADDGTIAVPQPGPDYDEAAWFTGSPRPGAVGPSVIEGHIDSAKDGPSVFARIGALAAGDRVTVTREDGSSVVFEVTGAQRYAKDDFPTLAVYGNTAGPELRLITCGGSFDAASGHYVDNTVVFARAL